MDIESWDPDEINLDRPVDLREYPIIPEWVQTRINQSDEDSLSDVFPSQYPTKLSGGTSKLAGHPNQKLYPITVFSLVQLLSVETGGEYFELYEIQNKHKNRLWQYEFKYVNETYRGVIESLVETDILVKRQIDGKTKYGLPDDEPVARAFRPGDSKCLLDDIVVDDPTTPKEIHQSTILPISLVPRRSINRSPSLGPFAALWDNGYLFSAVGTLLSVGYADLPLVDLFDPTSPLLVICWAVISLGSAMMLVSILDEFRVGYQIGTY
jgi:hypothetical protein